MRSMLSMQQKVWGSPRVSRAGDGIPPSRTFGLSAHLTLRV